MPHAKCAMASRTSHGAAGVSVGSARNTELSLGRRGKQVMETTMGHRLPAARRIQGAMRGSRRSWTSGRRRLGRTGTESQARGGKGHRFRGPRESLSRGPGGGRRLWQVVGQPRGSIMFQSPASGLHSASGGTGHMERIRETAQETSNRERSK